MTRLKLEYEKKEILFYDAAAKIECGYFIGNTNVLLIVVGQNGSIYGYEEKYIEMAKFYHQKYHITVAVASNPYNGSNMLDLMIHAIEKQLGKRTNIFCMGISNGARLCAEYAHLYENISKMLLINAPLMINWHKTKKGIELFRGTYVMFVYGDCDPSFSYTRWIPLLKNNYGAEVCLTIVKGADHNFKKHKREFFELAQCLFSEG
mgnify:CR=1 FL=1